MAKHQFAPKGNRSWQRFPAHKRSCPARQSRSSSSKGRTLAGAYAEARQQQEDRPATILHRTECGSGRQQPRELL